MVSSLRKAEIDGPDHVFYIKDEAMNSMLSHFTREAKRNGIWVSVEAVDLDKSNQQVIDTIQVALTHAMVSCIETTPPRNRFVKLRCRKTQRKLFIKILYSCEERKVCCFSGDILKIRERIDQSGGYMKQQLEKQEGIIKIAIPCN